MNKRSLLLSIIAAAALAAVLALSAYPVPVALAQGGTANGVLEAQVVISGSTATTGLSNLPVSMFVYQSGQRSPTPLVGATDAKGRARFEGLTTTSEVTFTVIVRYQEQFYRAEHVAFAPGATSVSVNIAVPAPAGIPAGNGAIETRVVISGTGSGSAAGTGAGGLSASLFAFTGANHTPNPLTGVTDAQGLVRFDGLSTSSDVTYTVLIQYQGMSFDTGNLKFAPGSTTLATTVAVPPVSTDASKVRIEQRHVVIEFDANTRLLHIAEFFRTSSGGASAYIGETASDANGKRVSMRLNLPPGAMLEGVDQRTLDQDLFVSGNTLLDGVPIPPSGGSLIVSYQLPYNRSTFALAVTSPYSTTALNFLLAPGINLRGQKLVANGAVPGTSFTQFTIRDLAPGSTTAVEITDLPAPLIPVDWLTWLPLALASIALAGLLVIAARRRAA